jgi:mono/diheme cytochrome c family protein
MLMNFKNQSPFGFRRSVTALGVILALGIGLEARADDMATTRRPLSGAALFQIACAECHGTKAAGKGPAAARLHQAVPDLTRIAARRGGKISDEELFRLIDGQADLGTKPLREMPAWGYEFFGDDPDDQIAHRQAIERIRRIMSYLRSIQRRE